jgi:hypothetical protein
MLASTPLRNNRPELIVDDGQGVVSSGASYSLARTRPGSGTLAQVYQQERHIGPIDSGMPAKTLVEGALSFWFCAWRAFHAQACCLVGGVEAVGSERSNSIGER